MMEWDRLFMEKMDAKNIQMPAAGRYIDDHNDAVVKDGEELGEPVQNRSSVVQHILVRRV